MIVIGLIITAIVLSGALLLYRRRRLRQNRVLALTAIQALSEDARNLHGRLLEALPQYIILPRISLAAFVEPKVVGNATKHPQISNALANATADFLICDSLYRPLAAVELDNSLTSPARQRSPMHALLKEAGIPLLRWDAIHLPEVPTIQEAIAELETLRLIGRARAAAATASAEALAWSYSRHESRH